MSSLKNLKVPQSTLVNSARVEIFTKITNIPSDFEFIEEIFAYSCKHLFPPATNEDALKRLKIEAYERIR